MELTITLTIEQLSVIEAVLKCKYQKLQNKQESEEDLLDIYKSLYQETLKRIHNALYTIQHEAEFEDKKKHPSASQCWETIPDASRLKLNKLETLLASI